MNLSLLRPRLEIVLAVGAGLLAFAANTPSANAKAPPLPPFEAGVEHKLAFDWVQSEDYWDVYWDLTRKVKLRFDREGISIPFSNRDVHFYPAQTHGASAPAAPVAATRTGSGRTALTGQGEPGAGSDT